MTHELRIPLPPTLVEVEVGMLRHRLIAIAGVLSATYLEGDHCVVVRLRSNYDTVLAVKRIAAETAQPHGAGEPGPALGRRESFGASEAHIG